MVLTDLCSVLFVITAYRFKLSEFHIICKILQNGFQIYEARTPTSFSTTEPFHAVNDNYHACSPINSEISLIYKTGDQCKVKYVKILFKSIASGIQKKGHAYLSKPAALNCRFV